METMFYLLAFLLASRSPIVSGIFGIYVVSFIPASLTDHFSAVLTILLILLSRLFHFLSYLSNLYQWFYTIIYGLVTSLLKRTCYTKKGVCKALGRARGGRYDVELPVARCVRQKDFVSVTTTFSMKNALQKGRTKKEKVYTSYLLHRKSTRLQFVRIHRLWLLLQLHAPEILAPMEGTLQQDVRCEQKWISQRRIVRTWNLSDMLVTRGPLSWC